MKKTKVYCDICGKEIKPGYGTDKGTLRLTGRYSKVTTQCGTINFQDICHGCTFKLFTLVNKLQGRVK